MILQTIMAIFILIASTLSYRWQEQLHVTNPQTSHTTNACIQEAQVIPFQNEENINIDNEAKQFPLTKKWRELIQQIRKQHKPSHIMPTESEGKNLCAGYLFELTSLLRGSDAPNTIGMLHPQTRSPADARELPYTYRYRGANIIYDIGNKIGKKLAKDPNSYRSLVSQEDINGFFAAAFSLENRLSDIWFLYNQTIYQKPIGSYGNYNSHIVKNMGISHFKIQVKKSDLSNNQAETILNVLACDKWNKDKLRNIMSHYQWTINNTPAYIDSTWQWWKKDKVCYQPYLLQEGDMLSYQDIIIAHFFETERVDSILQFVCQGDFAPINVININPKFLEKQ